MNCEDTRAWLQAYLDGELDLPQTIDIDRHLEDCVACSTARNSQQVLSRSIRAAGLAYRCPDGLRSRITGLVSPNVLQSTVPANVSRLWLAIAASILLLATVFWWGERLMVRSSARNAITQELVACHVRSLLADHLTDVASSDRHQVKPWFAGKLDFAPGVVDLSSDGFPLVGGRLDYLGHRSVAAVVYRRRQHVINLFIWPSDGSGDESRSETNNGYQLVHWNQAGTAYWAVSDLNVSELHQFAELTRNAASPTESVE
jgi:anti-sigma factor RsiW